MRVTSLLRARPEDRNFGTAERRDRHCLVLRDH
jgi:hypothetical protein